MSLDPGDGERDPSTLPDMDIREFPQDPEARQPGERLFDFWGRRGRMLRTPRQDFDPPWFDPDRLPDDE